MPDKQNTENNGTFDLGVQSAVKKAGEGFANRAVNAIVDGIKKVYKDAQVHLGTPFERYLENAVLRYNCVHTLATGMNSRSIIGEDNIYVSIGVSYGKEHISTECLEPLLAIGNNILINGTGGVGKSMMMRYFFLTAADQDRYVPVMLELRKISNQESEDVSVLDLIYTCMQDFDISLDKEQFEYSLRLGKYLFLMDGFDEIKESKAAKTATAIQDFCSKYPKNPCIITSRPRRDTQFLETFTEVNSLPLTKQQAIELAAKIWEKDEKTEEFCRQLDENLYENHNSFAKNPLLLSMMFLTFMRNNSVPNHLAEFYSKAYDALYSTHDSRDKGYYRREFSSKLSESEFRMLLSHFCFQSYFKEEYEFTQEKLLEYLKKGIEKCGLCNVTAENFLADLKNVVCLIVKDGDIYRFSHRSFQTYFAACYTSAVLTDEQQKKLFRYNLLNGEIFWRQEDYYKLLSQIEHRRFTVNALADNIRKIKDKAEKSGCAEICLLKLQFKGFMEDIDDDSGSIAFAIENTVEGTSHYNIIALFRRYVADIKNNRDKSLEADVHEFKNKKNVFHIITSERQNALGNLYMHF